MENILSEFRALLESLNFRDGVVLEMGRFLAATQRILCEDINRGYEGE